MGWIKSAFAVLSFFYLNCAFGVTDTDLLIHVRGKIFDLDAKPESVPVYLFERTAKKSGTDILVDRKYTSPTSEESVIEKLVYSNGKITRFDLDDLKRGRKIQIQFTDKKLIFTENNKSEEEDLEDNTLINDQIAPWLSERFSELLAGNKLKIRLVVPLRKDTVGFKFKMIEKKETPPDQILVEMYPTSPVISLLVKSLYFYLEKDGKHRIRRYDGRATPAKKSDDSWKDFDGTHVYDFLQ